MMWMRIRKMRKMQIRTRIALKIRLRSWKSTWCENQSHPRFSCLSFRRESLGSIRMKVRLTQERILPQQYYQSLVEILMNSVSDPESQSPTALSLIEKLTPADQMTLACQLVRLFIGQGLVIQFLDYMTLQEIRKSSKKLLPSWCR